MTARRPTWLIAPRSGRAVRTGFTLVELLVVIGVMVLLLGITVAVIPMVNAQAKRRETEASIEILAAALQDWEVNSERTITWYEDDLPGAGARYDMQRTDPDVVTVTRVLAVIRRAPSSRSMITAMPGASVVEYLEGQPPAWITNPGIGDPDPNAAEALAMFEGDVLTGQTVALDAWGTPIRAVHPGLEWDFTVDPDFPGGADEDGSVRTLQENRYGVCVGRNICFVSAGPDRKFGVPDPDHALFRDSVDNVYSYQLGELP